MSGRKKRIGFISSSLIVQTGFSNNMRRLLPFLYQTDKYELFHLNQGVQVNHPEFERYPWANEGVMNPVLIDHARFNNPNEEAYRRFVSYGNLSVHDFVINNKLDVVFHVEDIWSSDLDNYTQSNWYKLIQKNFVQWSTADSLPILINFKKWAEKTPNMWFWSSFAEKALKEEDPIKYGHTSTVHGCIDINEYQPMLKAERDMLRQSFGIDPNTIIFIQLGRNQLRKLYPVTLESFAKFKKHNPNVNAKLLFHTSWSEGWNLNQLMEDHGVNREDVLTTYFCQHCGKWEIKPFYGENLDCRFCGASKKQITAGITSSITNKDIAKIYGIADACVSPFTSGGLEYCNLESMLCELPLLCSDYSCGKDFTAQNFVYKLDGTFNYEIGTNFLKFNPNRNTFIKFFETISKMSYADRKKIGKKGRQWVSETFSVEKIGQKIIDFIDECDYIDWTGFDKNKVELKNPEAKIPNIESNSEWVKTLYKEILLMNVDDNDSGYKHWMNSLDKGMPRQEIENYFRNIALNENKQKEAQKPIDFASILDNTGNPRLLIVAKESIGDLLYATSLLKSFKESYPNHDIYLATDPQYSDIFMGNQYIHKIIPYLPHMDSEITMIGQGSFKGYFDVYCNLFAPSQKFLNYLSNHNINLKLRYD